MYKEPQITEESLLPCNGSKVFECRHCKVKRKKNVIVEDILGDKKNKWINKDQSKIRIGHQYFCGRENTKEYRTVHMLIAEQNWNAANCLSAMNCFVHNFIST
jgi:hypothetical protein